MLGPSVRHIIGVPDYYHDEYNSTPMINFWGVFEHLLTTFEPRHICEIGSERGITSSRLAQLLPSTIVSVVDPIISDEVKKRPNVSAYEETSKAFLERRLPIGFYIIDGDHNYETVELELNGALLNAPDDLPFCAVFHDVGWPFARRDGYYDPATVSDPKPYLFDIALKLEDDEIHEGSGWENGQSFALAREHGGPRNGIRTAIEDFARKQGDGWHFLYLPAFYGLGIVWCDRHLDESRRMRMRELERAIEVLRPVFACSEANRLRLIQGLNEHKAHIANLESRLDRIRRKPIRTLLDGVAGKMGFRRG